MVYLMFSLSYCIWRNNIKCSVSDVFNNNTWRVYVIDPYVHVFLFAWLVLPLYLHVWLSCNFIKLYQPISCLTTIIQYIPLLTMEKSPINPIKYLLYFVPVFFLKYESLSQIIIISIFYNDLDVCVSGVVWH